MRHLGMTEGKWELILTGLFIQVKLRTYADGLWRVKTGAWEEIFGLQRYFDTDISHFEGRPDVMWHIGGQWSKDRPT